MNDEHFDQIFAKEDELIPSSGFASLVMERIREEASAPPPIPFPWKRALPGAVLAAVGLGWGLVEVARMAIAAAHSPETAMQMPQALSRPVENLGWTAGALGVAFFAWLAARRFAGDSRLF
jgi:hypothetical protein